MAAELSPASWLRATTLIERIESLPSAGDKVLREQDVDHGRVEERIQRWRSQLPAPERSFSTETAAVYGVSQEVLLCIASEQDGDLAARHPRPPPWLQNLLASFREPLGIEPADTSPR